MRRALSQAFLLFGISGMLSSALIAVAVESISTAIIILFIICCISTLAGIALSILNRMR